MRVRPRVTVLGSLNMDISVTVPELPVPGATVLGGAARFTPGGKGANQAVAAARLGADVRMAGCVGADDFGRQLVAALDADGVATADVAVDHRTPTGLAMITVDAAGENMITVASGANHQVGAAQARAAALWPADILVVSAEIPLPAIEAAIRAAAAGVPCLLNLAPAPPPPDAAALVALGVDWLVVNGPEAAAVLGDRGTVTGVGQARDAARRLLRAGARNAVVTAGPAGAAFAGHDVPGGIEVAAHRVTAIDTVGAGDTFTGALAVALAAGVPPRDAVAAAAAAAATAVTRHGAQAGMPRPADIRALLNVEWPVRSSLISNNGLGTRM